MALRHPYLLYFVIIGLILSWTLLFPALNWPDEVYKLERILIDKNLYARFLAYWQPYRCDVQTQYLGKITYLSNSLHIRALGDLNCYYVYKFINAALFSVFVLLGYKLLQSAHSKSVFLLSMIWPPVLFFASSINQQTIFIVISIYIVTAAINSKKYLLFFTFSIPLFFLDRGFVSLSVFLLALSVLSWRPKAGVPMVAVMIFTAVFFRSSVLQFIDNLGYLELDKSIGEISEGLARLQDPIYISLGLLLISAVYLGGTNSLFGIGIDYMFVFSFLAIAFWRQRANTELQIYILAFLFTYFLILSVIPSIQTFRYYIFIAPVFIHFLLSTPTRRKIYIVYCLSMSTIYLLMANVANI